MTKMTRIALAALAVMGATTAMAQSSVTLYGRINTTVERQKVGDESVSGLSTMLRAGAFAVPKIWVAA
jgi:predicted porin